MIKWEYRNKSIVVLSLLIFIASYCLIRVIMNIAFSHTISIGDIFMILTFLATLAILYGTFRPKKELQPSKVVAKKKASIDYIFLTISLAVLFMAVGLWAIVVMRGIGIPSVFFAVVFLTVCAIAYGYTTLRVYRVERINKETKGISRGKQGSKKTKKTKKNS